MNTLHSSVHGDMLHSNYMQSNNAKVALHLSSLSQYGCSQALAGVVYLERRIYTS